MDLAGERPKRGHRLWARSQRAFVRGETDRALDPGDPSFAADIGDDVENTRTRDRAGCASHWGQPFVAPGRDAAAGSGNA